MNYNEIFSIIRIGTYEQYEKSIADVDIDCPYQCHQAAAPWLYDCQRMP